MYSGGEREEIISAARWAMGLHHNQKRASGEPYIIHPLHVALILIDLKLDHMSIIAALLHDVIEDTNVTKKDIRNEFGKDVELLVDGVTKISEIKAKSKTIQEAETIRKMLFAMVKDIRVILIKLADKLHNMRTLEYLDKDKQKKNAQECLDIYAPLAGRLGISRIKDELEDISLKFLNPMVYEHIKKFVSEKKTERADYLEKVKRAILGAAGKEGIEIDVKARAKHFYSIYYKMKKHSKQIQEIYDLLGLRILCRTQAECYTLLGIVHTLWMPISGRFKDYIAMPKANRYQSLHTTVMCYEGKMIEIQIRTFEMDHTAENGIAAHWLYKKGFSKEHVRIEDLAIINKLKTWNSRAQLASTEFLEEIKSELLKDTIYVFTPKGDIIELPKDATAIDFAYHIHTEVGNHCVNAKADGHIIPLRKPLTNAQVIEVQTNPNFHPHINWLKYAKTSRARSKIKHWLNMNDPDQMLILSQQEKKKEQAQEKHVNKKEKAPSKTRTTYMNLNKIGVVIQNEKNIMVRFALCCKAVLGDEIVGYVSRGRGIIVHKKSCPNLKYIKDIEERLVDVAWETIMPKSTGRYRIRAKTETDLFSEIEQAIRKLKGNLIEGHLEKTYEDSIMGIFTIEMENHGELRKVIKSLQGIPSIISIQRIQG
ncbi:MAG: bifunctional (p)ppGpp synthetase/guanosine-3',5'-bis(diphosphate) 3'-pyrophosphohydrolase [Spirochaetales bacterium]|nr:bifunctional (p)ppGpp synthetase/guanosine-3',5'-bis(diphosphate) 3'-pyrophosphohydrolase [Spirochaetales bacterium]